MRNYTELAKDLTRYDDSPEGLHKLQRHIMHTWTVIETITFRESILPNLTTRHDDKPEPNLCRLFRDLATFCVLHIGAATMLDMNPAAILEMTPHALGLSIPSEKRKLLERLDFATRLDRIEGEVGNLSKGLKAAAKEGAKVGVSRGLIPAVKRASREGALLALDGPDATKPKTRSSDGGRKKERDLDNAQVKAVLALTKRKNLESLRAYSVEIIRDMMNGKGEYQNPYDKPKDLDAAVRRYCKRIGKPLVFKPRKGKWSAKS